MQEYADAHKCSLDSAQHRVRRLVKDGIVEPCGSFPRFLIDEKTGRRKNTRVVFWKMKEVGQTDGKD